MRCKLSKKDGESYCSRFFASVIDHQPLQIPMRRRKPNMPAMRRVTSRVGDSTVHLLNFAVADSTEANKDSRDSMKYSCRDSNFSSGEPI